MVKKVLAAAVVLLVMVSGAWAEVYLWSEHASIASLKDGKSDYSSARFFHMWLDVERDDGTVATEEYLNASGTMIISGGDYSFVNKGKIQNVQGASMNFTLAPDTEYMTLGGSYIGYNSKADDGNELAFVLDADGGDERCKCKLGFPVFAVNEWAGCHTKLQDYTRTA